MRLKRGERSVRRDEADGRRAVGDALQSHCEKMLHATGEDVLDDKGRMERYRGLVVDGENQL